MQKLTEIQEKWLQELESRKHTQGQGCLMTKDEEYCCLGVAARFVFGIEPEVNSINIYFETESAILTEERAKQLGLHKSNSIIKEEYQEKFYEVLKSKGYVGFYRPQLTSYNDSGATFQQIAAAIRELPEAVFISE